MSKFNRWIRSKTGVSTMIAAVVILLVVAVVGQQLQWWDFALPGAGGTKPNITLPAVSYKDPTGGYTCLPTCSEIDTKMFSVYNSGAYTFAGEKIVVWIAVPGNKANFELGIFDGDSSKDDTGALNQPGGNWDSAKNESVYTLYADPLENGAGTVVVGTWRGNTDNMPNNKWWTTTVANVVAAKAPSRHYFYRLEIAQEVEGGGANNFKLRSSGYLIAGNNAVNQSSIAIIGAFGTKNDYKILYPDFKSLSDLGATTNYNGQWSFSMYVPQDSNSLTVWDGDFDRGTDSADPQADDDDPNFSGKPEWASSYTKDEGRGGSGMPADNYKSAFNRRTPEVQYRIYDPAGNPVYQNGNPSGTEEWEKFSMSTDPNSDADVKVDKLQPGFYNLEIEGLDVNNVVFLRTDKLICDPINGCGPCVWPGCNASACPRTIGYWKNNVRKVYINKTTTGVQESKETLDWALKAIAMQSPIYRAGLVNWIKANPKATTIAPIATAAPLSPTEADAIMQKTTAFGNSMLGRALQQNLATWLNFASGKISDNAIIVINVPSGQYNGTMFGALLEAQNIMLNGGNVERAKDIADMINNGKINSDPASNVDGSGNVNCAIYSTVAPTDKQPKKYDELPKAPKPEDKPNQTPPQEDINTCDAISNNYNVENPTFNPFYSIKFEYKSGTEVKDGGLDVFQYTMTKEQLTAFNSMQLEAKAGELVGIATMECSFVDGAPCTGVIADNMMFSFTYLGATENSDGTLTLMFQVQNNSSFGLSHVSFGLPTGTIPSGPSNNGSYDSKVCK